MVSKQESPTEISTLLGSTMPDHVCLTLPFWQLHHTFFPFNSTRISSKISVHIFYRNLLNIFSIPICQHKIFVLNDANEPQIGWGGSSLSFVEKLRLASGISSQELCWWPFLKCQTEGTKLLKCFQEAARLQNDGRVGQGQHYNSATNFLVVKFGVL